MRIGDLIGDHDIGGDEGLGIDQADGEMITDVFVIVRYVDADSTGPGLSFAASDGYTTSAKIGDLTQILDRIRAQALHGWKGDE